MRRRGQAIFPALSQFWASGWCWSAPRLACSAAARLSWHLLCRPVWQMVSGTLAIPVVLSSTCNPAWTSLKPLFSWLWGVVGGAEGMQSEHCWGTSRWLLYYSFTFSPVCSRNRFVRQPLGKAVSSRKQLWGEMQLVTSSKAPTSIWVPQVIAAQLSLHKATSESKWQPLLLFFFE